MVILFFQNLTSDEVSEILKEQEEKLGLISTNEIQLYKTADDNSCVELIKEGKLENGKRVERDINSMKWKDIIKGKVTLTQ